MDEKLVLWKDPLATKYSWVQQNVSNINDPIEACRVLNDSLKQWFILTRFMDRFPTTPSIYSLHEARRGTCWGMVTLATYTMRSIGLPVGIDYVDINNRPGLLKNRKDKDVTHLYSEAFDVKLSIKPSDVIRDEKVAYLCVFNNVEWVAVEWGEIVENEVIFKNMGWDVLYLPAYYKRGRYIPFNSPFVLEKDGNLSFYRVGHDQISDLKLKSKYPVFDRILGFADRMIGGKFQGTNHPNLANWVDLYAIEKRPNQFLTTASINSNQIYKYLRYIGPTDGYSDIGELEFWNGSEKLNGKIIGQAKNQAKFADVFDGVMWSYFYSDDPGKGEWVGLEIENPKKITHIKFLPRTDYNVIEPGDNYELLYWDDEWISSGRKIAEERVLFFKNVPQNTVYWLRNLDHGVQERIFTYSSNKQVWW